MSISAFSVKNRILANVLTITILVGGVIATVMMRREVFPQVELDWVIITTLYPNASPAEVEELVTAPIEDQIREVEEIDECHSTSEEGVSTIAIKIDSDARYKERAINDIQRKVDMVRNLPSEVEDPVLTVISIDEPLINVAVSGPVEEKALRDYGDYLKKRLEKIPNVSVVTKTGWRDEEFWVEVDPTKLQEQEISLVQIMNRLALRNINLPGGKIPSGSREPVLRTVGKFHTPEEAGEVFVRSNPEGNYVCVADLAKVSRGFKDDSVYLQMNGTRALTLGVKKKTAGDVIKIADAVHDIVREERELAPEGVELSIVDDSSFYVKRRLNVLASNGAIGMGLVMICLFIFMNWRVAIVTAIGIPFSFLATFVLMSMFGVTVNLMTMFGLIIVLGMLVDDALIIGENCFRHIEEGMPPDEAAIKGSEEVTKPVISTVLTTVVAFAPLVFAPDVYGEILQWLTWVVIIALGTSLFEALIIPPSHIADFVRPLKHIHHPTGEGAPFGHKWMRSLHWFYGGVLRRVLRFRYLFLGLMVVVFFSLTGVVKKHMWVAVFPADLIDIFIVRVTAAQGTSLTGTEEAVRRVEEKIRALPDDELDTLIAHIGQHMDMAHGGFTRGPHYAQILVYLTPQETRERKTQAIIDQLRADTEGLAGVEKLEFEMIKGGPPSGKPVEVMVRGLDLDVLDKISEEIKAFLAAQEGVRDIQDDFEAGKDELHVIVDEREAARLGVSVDAVSRIVYAAFEGPEATIVREGKEEIKVRVRLQEEFRSREDTLDRLMVPNETGRLIPLSRVVRMERTKGLPTLHHYDGDRVITVGANINPDITSAMTVNTAVQAAFADIPQRYPGYELIGGGEWKETKKIVDFMIKALAAALLLIYTILTVQFGSFFQPLFVMVSIPLGFVGVILALVLHNQPVSMMAMMGMVGLGGVVDNDAIVLVSFINDRRRDGLSVFDAVFEGAKTRLRPIMLTSVTTVCGLVPTIYGWGGYEPFIIPAAVTLAYGLLFATFLTLLVVPCIYMAGYDITDLPHKIRARFSRSKSPFLDAAERKV
jgi:multidrug efflux pump subunit AcrB